MGAVRHALRAVGGCLGGEVDAMICCPALECKQPGDRRGKWGQVGTHEKEDSVNRGGEVWGPRRRAKSAAGKWLREVGAEGRDNGKEGEGEKGG